jgi:hypothetical protein
MIDYFMKWNAESDAIAAANAAGRLGHYDNQNNWHWDLHYVLPNVQAWRISQDVTNPDGSVTHKYLAGWFCIVSTINPNATLKNDPATQFTLNRDGPPYVVDNNIGAIITDVCCQPIFAGSHYPIGGYN